MSSQILTGDIEVIVKYIFAIFFRILNRNVKKIMRSDLIKF